MFLSVIFDGLTSPHPCQHLVLSLLFFKFCVFLAVPGLHCCSRLPLAAVSGASLPWRVQAAHCGGFSCVAHRALGFCSCRVQILKRCTVGVVRGLSCPVACKILLDQDQTCLPCIGRRTLNHWTTRAVLVLSLVFSPI